jgi:hypothetical protein
MLPSRLFWMQNQGKIATKQQVVTSLGYRYDLVHSFYDFENSEKQNSLHKMHPFRSVNMFFPRFEQA